MSSMEPLSTWVGTLSEGQEDRLTLLLAQLACCNTAEVRCTLCTVLQQTRLAGLFFLTLRSPTQVRGVRFY